MLRAATILRGMATGAASERIDIQRWKRAIASPTLTARRIGFMQMHAGVGATATAGAVARTITSGRSVLGVDLATSGASSGIAASIPVTTRSSTRETASSTAEAQSGLTESHGAFLLRPEPQQDKIGTWLREAAPIARYFDSTVTDFGVLGPRTDMSAAVALCDVVCMVSAAERPQAELALALARGMQTAPHKPFVCLILVDRAGTSAHTARLMAERSPVSAVVVPRDAALSHGRAPRTIAAQTAILQLSALIATRGEVS